MKNSVQQFHDYVMQDLFANFDDITSKRMFGGYGLYYQDTIFGLITSESELYFKADNELSKQFKELGSHQFVYTGHKNKKPTSMPYWTVPESIMNDKQELFEWIQTSANLSKK